METARSGLFALSPLKGTAAFSIAILFGAIAWNIAHDPSKNADILAQDTSAGLSENIDLSSLAATSSESTYISPISEDIVQQLLAAYSSSVSADGSYSSAAGVQAATELGMNIDPQVSFKAYAAGDVRTVADTSKDRVLAYRADLRVALEPLLKNKEMELEVYGRYIETGDAAYLAQLHAAAINYRAAVTNAANVIVPADAASYHAGILNAMGKFATTLDAMASTAQDPLASAALLKTYNDAQAGMLVSFDAIGAYAAAKTL